MSSDYEYPQRGSYEYSQGGSSGNRTALIIVAIVAAVILIVVAVCGGLTYLGIRAFTEGMSKTMDMVQDMQMSEVAPRSFLNDLATGQVDAAYDQTTAGFQARQNRQEFQKFVDKHPLLTKHITSNLQPLNLNPGTSTYTATLTGPQGAMINCTITVIKEGEQWKVDRISIP